MTNKILKIAIIAVLCIILVLAIVLFACSPDDDGKTTTTTTTTTTKNPEPTPCEKHTDADKDGKCDVCGEIIEDCTSHVDSDGDGKCDKCGAAVSSAPVTDDKGFTEASGTVYVTSVELNIRTSPEISSDNLYSSAKYSDALTRTGENGKWTRIDVGGKTCYVSTDCVSATKPIDPETDFETKNDTIYVISESLTARSTPFYDEDGTNIVTSFDKGTALKRVAIATKADADGITWSRVEAELTEDGKTVTKTVYVSSSSKYVSTEKNTTSDADRDGDVKFTASSDVLTVKGEGDRPLRDSTEYPGGEILAYAKVGTKLQATAKGTESDGTIWYKVSYEGKTYYVIYKNTYFDISTGSATPVNQKKTLFGEYNITLTSDFALDSTYTQEGLMYQYQSSDGIAVSVAKAATDGSLSVTELANQVIAQMELEDVEPQTRNGVTYFEFSLQVSVGTQTVDTYYIVAFTKGTNNVYYATTIGAPGTKASVSSTLWGYLDTIKIS